MAGAYVAQLNVTSSLFLQDNSVRTEKIPTVVTLQAIAEDPQIQVFILFCVTCRGRCTNVRLWKCFRSF